MHCHPYSSLPPVSIESWDALGGCVGAYEQREHLFTSPELQGLEERGAGQVNHVAGIPQVADQLTEAGTVVKDILTRQQECGRQEILQ